MSTGPGKLTRLWQELKRRKVIYVITVYASAAFVIIELVNNVLEPLNLPENLSTVVIIALAAAFPIVVVLSWIFDMTPKGIEKTKSTDEQNQEEKVKTSNAWRIATYASIVIIIGLISLNIVNNNKISQYLKLYGKSIAVLPFVNDSPDKENEYFVNGTVDALRNNLALLKDLKVVSRLSVEHYKAALIPIPEIAAEQEVAYILTGSVQKYGNQIRLSVQLYDANDNLIWSNSYDREIREAEDRFLLQSEIANLVAGEIKVVVTPEEIQRIVKVPTTSIQANDFVIQAFESLMINGRDWPNQEALQKADNLYHKAITYDSTYAEAYIGLGFVNVMRTLQRRPDPLRERFGDSILIYADIAFSLDRQLSDVYLLRGVHSHYVKGDYYDALDKYNQALELNPNNWGAYEFKGYVLAGMINYVESIENWEKIIERERGPTNLPQFLKKLAYTYYLAGFPEIAALKYEDYLDYTGDSATYYVELSNLEYSLGNYKKVVDLKIRALEIDSRSTGISLLNYINAGLYEEAYEEAEKVAEEFMRTGRGLNSNTGYAGYSLWNAGKIEAAEYLFNAYIESGEEMTKLVNYQGNYLFLNYILATVYAFTGNKEKAYEYLDLFAKEKSHPLYRVTWFKNDPMFDSIRHEERFQKIMELVEGNYQAEHERVREWLEKTGRMKVFAAEISANAN